MVIGNALGGSLGSDINTAVARKALDVAEQQGQAAVDLIKGVVEANQAARGSVSPVPNAGEPGQLVNTLA